MNATRAVMYLGNKSMKFDNVNGIPERKWHGPGAVVAAISPAQADKLCAYKEEFLDVTALTEKEVAARAAKAKADSEERKRQNRRGTTKDGSVTLAYATEQELEAELARRREARKAQATPEQKPETKAKGGGRRAEKSKSQLEITEAVESAIGKLLEKNHADDFDNGIPTKVAVERELGFSLTDTEFEIALGSNAPAEQPDKTGFSDRK